MWDRLAAARLRRLWRQFPAVLILGARQVGKTTLARQTFPRLPYVDLEEPRSRERFGNAEARLAGALAARRVSRCTPRRLPRLVGGVPQDVRRARPPAARRRGRSPPAPSPPHHAGARTRRVAERVCARPVPRRLVPHRPTLPRRARADVPRPAPGTLPSQRAQTAREGAEGVPA